jgi:preprotein translocase subunit SecG
MLTLLMILAVLIAVVLIAVVLIQNPKGSGLASNFSSGNQFFGVKKTTDIVEKITWVAAGLVMAISLIAAAYNPKGTATETNNATPSGKIDPQLEEIMQKGLPATPPMNLNETPQNESSEEVKLEGNELEINIPQD